MIEWLTDTLVATGALMALVLVLRRPVARWFGPGAAYALWALPMIRLVLPPLALPRGLIPQLRVDVEPVTAAAASMASAAAPTPLDHAGLAAAAVDLSAHAPIATSSAAAPSLLAQVPWTGLALAVWLGGAALFLVWRTVTYRWMRRDLLDGARLVATSGAVRIVETPAITAPLAFGVFDKVIALPRGFLAEADSETSDFAIAHEMEHHAGSDLLALIALQPLFALHWFNPIGWAAWRAVRGDQEAFCDARVMAGRSRAEKARYGRLIASLASGTRLGLAAPMAGPLSGEKPIIHRLKALAARDVTPARRVLGRSLFALAIVTVPATATVSYAAMDAADAPIDSTQVAHAAPAVPAVPAIPAVSARGAVPAMAAIDEAPEIAEISEGPEAPEAPQAPDLPSWPAPAMPPAPPAPPAVPAPPVMRATIDQRIERDVQRRAADAERTSADARRRAAEAWARAPKVEESLSADGRRRTIRIVRKDGAVSSERTMILDEDCPADSHREARGQGRGAGAAVVICTGEPKAARQAALTALRGARASIAGNRDLDAQVRADILADLDRQIVDAQGS